MTQGSLVQFQTLPTCLCKRKT